MKIFKNFLNPWLQPPKGDDAVQKALRHQNENIAFYVAILIFLIPFMARFSVAKDSCFPSAISQMYWRTDGIFTFVMLSITVGLTWARSGEARLETVLGRAVGVALMGVVLFPTSPTGCDKVPFDGRLEWPVQQRPAGDIGVVGDITAADLALPGGADLLHVLAVVVFVALLVVHCFYVFTRIIDARHRDQNQNLFPEKKTRNCLYVGCGLIILGCGVVMGLATWGAYLDGAQTGAAAWLAAFAQWWGAHNASFWAEFVILIVFGIAWSIKGKMYHVSAGVGWTIKDRK